jgi:hypothetical protein
VRGIQEILSLAIFDRWAENVYFQKNIPPGVPELGWDGTFDGQLVQPGVYVVVAECLLADGTVWRYKGDVVVTR